MAKRSNLDRILSFVILALILAAIGTLAYTLSNPKAGEKFTEFYVLGANGQAADYPVELKVGQQANVTLGIVNRERETATYRVEVTGAQSAGIGPLTLDNGAKVEEPLSFRVDKAGEKQQIQFLLYKNGQVQPYLELHLWVNITQ